MEAKIEAIGQVLDHLLRYEVFYIGPIPVTSTVVNTWIVMLGLFVVVWLLTRKGFERIPRGVQSLLEIAIEFIYSIIDANYGRSGRRYLYLVGSFFLFIWAMNLSWFIPDLVPPTTDIMTTAALGIVAVLSVHVVAIREKGFANYVKHYLKPSPIMAPMTLLEEVTKPFSLALRLFGNMFGEKMVVTILFLLVPLLVPVPVMFLGLLMGTIQAYIFSLLVTTYLAHFTGEDH